jgi:RNA polymerase sigma-70 factor (ECF subfamily)
MVDRTELDIAQVVADHHRGVFKYAYRLTGSVPDAEDLTQQAFLTAQQKLGQLRNADSVRSWLFTILRNCFLKGCQKRLPTPAANLSLNVDSVPEKIPPGSEIDRERLQEAIDELPPKFRIVLVMFYYEDRSYREIADQLELPMGTVMSRLARAKGHLRARLLEAQQRDTVGQEAGATTQQG